MLNNITSVRILQQFLSYLQELSSDPYVLLSSPYALFLVKAATFFDGSKIPTSVLCMIHQGTFMPSLVQIGQVVLEEKIFKRNNIKNSKKMSKKRSITPT